MNWSLRSVPVYVRWLLAAFLIINAAGYSVGLLLVARNTHLTVEGVADHYAGNEEKIAAGEAIEEFKFQPTKRQMLSLAHTHIFNMSVSYLMVGLILSACAYSDRLKRWLILETILAILTTFLGLWLTAFVHRGFAWLAFISSLFMGLGYYGSVVLALVDIFRNHRDLPVHVSPP